MEQWQGKKTAKCIVKGCRHASFACGYEDTTRPLWQHLESSHHAIYKNTEDYKKNQKYHQIKVSRIC